MKYIFQILLLFFVHLVLCEEKYCSHCTNEEGRLFLERLKATCDSEIELCYASTNTVRVHDGTTVELFDEFLDLVLQKYPNVKQLMLHHSMLMGEVKMKEIFDMFPNLVRLELTDNAQLFGKNMLDFLVDFDSTRFIQISLDGVNFESKFPSSILPCHMLLLTITLTTSIDWDVVMANPELYEFNIHGPLDFDDEFPSNIDEISSKMTIFHLSDLNLRGTIPDTICEMKALADLKLSKNNFEGTVPKCIGEMPNLTGLDIQNNAFTDIDENIFQNSRLLSNIRLASNSFTGPMPLISEVALLGRVDFSNIPFEAGPIPTPYINETLKENNDVQALYEFDVSNTNRIGTIPTEFSDLEMKSFRAKNNDLTGDIPPFKLGSENHGLEFAVSYNNLSGVLDLEQMILNKPHYITSFEIGHNNGISITPNTIEGITSYFKPGFFREFDLNGVGIIGNIPNSMPSNWNFLYYVDFSNNPGLVGQFPADEYFCQEKGGMLSQFDVRDTSLDCIHRYESLRCFKEVNLIGGISINNEECHDGVVSNFEAYDIESTSLKVRWNETVSDDSDFRYFEVISGPPLGYDFPEVSHCITTDLTCEVNGLLPYIQYEFRVDIIFSWGLSSLIHSVDTPLQAISVRMPTGTTICPPELNSLPIQIESTSITLSWSPPNCEGTKDMYQLHCVTGITKSST